MTTVPYADLVLQSLASSTFLRATFSGPPRLNKTSTLRRVMVRPVDLQGTPHLLVARFDDRKDVTHNYPLTEIPAALSDVLAIGFANVQITTTTEDLDIRLTKKNEVQIGRKKRRMDASESPTAPQPHNRIKALPLPEGAADHVLQLMGIMTDDGQIRPTMRAKYTQINEFLKLLDHVLPELPPSDKPLQILDCGSGSAYLTLATHHYLNDIKKIPAHLLGIDLNDDLIKKSTQLASQLPSSSPSVDLSALCDSVVTSASPTSNLQFLTAHIGGGGIENLHPDIVLALHACDTATDDAIAQAIKSNAKLLLAVPCCHKNLNKSLHAEILAPLHHHGILHQRLADLATDALRAQILRIMGYRTEVIEFISPEHTAKNLMIRALKIPNTPNTNFLKEYAALKSFFGVTPYLETALGPLFPSI